MKLYEFYSPTPESYQLIFADDIHEATGIFLPRNSHYLLDKRKDHWYLQYNGSHSAVVHEHEIVNGCVAIMRNYITEEIKDESNC